MSLLKWFMVFLPFILIDQSVEDKPHDLDASSWVYVSLKKSVDVYSDGVIKKITYFLSLRGKNILQKHKTSSVAAIFSRRNSEKLGKYKN